ncbi:MAG: elongation factor G [Chromatiales bacterium]
MASYTTADIRNVAIVGTAGGGKTTLIEALAHRTGGIKTMGAVDKGTTLSDFDPQEKVLQHSLHTAIVSLDHQGKHINLIDTPGYPDFIGRALAVLPAVETVAVVINAASGVDMVAHKMMAWAKERELDRLIIVNRIDAENVDLEKCLADIRAAFGMECLPINLPAQKSAAVADCFFKPDGGPTDFSSVKAAHSALVDQVVEVDEKLMEVYLEQGEELDPEQLHDPFEKALREGHLIPVCFTSARSGAGVAELLEIVIRLLPGPTEGNAPTFLKGGGEAAERLHFSADAKGHALAHVFKVTIDPFVGRIGVFRIHQGTVTKDSQLFICDGRKPFKVAHLLKLKGKDTAEISDGIPGDICAVAKVDDLHFDAVVHDSHDEDHIRLRPISFPEPMQGLAVHAKSRGDEQKISDALHKLAAEDPSMRVEYNPQINQTVIRGMGELHLRVLLEDLRTRFHVELETSQPRIAYKETITAPAEGHHRHKKQTGGAGQFGEVFLRVSPLPRGAGFEFVDAVVGGVIPRQFIPAVEKGIRQALTEGVIAGFPMQDIQVTVYDGKYHTVDSKEVAFVTAGKKAFIDAVKKARPVVLEPIVDVNITAPSNCMGDIAGDLSSKRGRVNSTDIAGAGSMTAISGQVPLAELNGYQSRLKSLTGGTGSYSVQLSHYDPVPARLQQQLMADFKPAETED